MSKITNDDLTRSGTGCFIAVFLWQPCASRVNLYCCTVVDVMWFSPDSPKP